MKNNWFFDSKENVDEFYRVSRTFLKAQSKLLSARAGKLVNKKSVALEGSIFAGAGRGWVAEFAVHQDKLGFMCSPSYSLKTDLGAEAEFAFARSLSCTDNESYAGEGVSFTASISGELIGLPVGIGAAYSLSIDTVAFRRKILEAKNAGLLSAESLRSELHSLEDPRLKHDLSSYRYALPLMTLVLRPLALFNIAPPILSTKPVLTNFVRDMMKHDRSAGNLFKVFYNRQLRSQLVKHRLNSLNAYFSILNSSITGCDSFGGSASLGLSLSPVSVGVAYSNSILIAEAAAPELLTFGSLTPMSLLNPFLLQPQDLRNIVKLSRSFVTAATKVKRQCLK